MPSGTAPTLTRAYGGPRGMVKGKHANSLPFTKAQYGLRSSTTLLV
jgi:hypothetical protein